MSSNLEAHAHGPSLQKHVRVAWTVWGRERAELGVARAAAAATFWSPFALLQRDKAGNLGGMWATSEPLTPELLLPLLFEVK